MGFGGPFFSIYNRKNSSVNCAATSWQYRKKSMGIGSAIEESPFSTGKFQLHKRAPLFGDSAFNSQAPLVGFITEKIRH